MQVGNSYKLLKLLIGTPRQFFLKTRTFIFTESGFEDQEHVEKGQNVVKFVSRFADKVCSETHITEDHIKGIYITLK